MATVVQSSAGQAIPGLANQPDGAVLVAGAEEGSVSATRLVAWVAAFLVGLGLLTSLLLPRNAARVLSEGYAPPTGAGKQ